MLVHSPGSRHQGKQERLKRERHQNQAFLSQQILRRKPGWVLLALVKLGPEKFVGHSRESGDDEEASVSPLSRIDELTSVAVCQHLNKFSSSLGPCDLQQPFAFVILSVAFFTHKSPFLNLCHFELSRCDHQDCGTESAEAQRPGAKGRAEDCSSTSCR